MAYTYNADGNRANVTYPDYATFAYTYTGRNQLKSVGPWATYTYDENGYTGDLTTCTLNNGTQTHLQLRSTGSGDVDHALAH